VATSVFQFSSLPSVQNEEQQKFLVLLHYLAKEFQAAMFHPDYFYFKSLKGQTLILFIDSPKDAKKVTEGIYKKRFEAGIRYYYENCVRYQIDTLYGSIETSLYQQEPVAKKDTIQIDTETGELLSANPNSLVGQTLISLKQ
jgi:hypothetical protein